jgi:hypothetical protein
MSSNDQNSLLAEMQLNKLEVYTKPVDEFDVITKKYLEDQLAITKAAATQAVTDLVGGADSALDTLAEIGAAIADGSDAAGALAAQMTAIQASLAAESKTREEDDLAIQDLVDDESKARAETDARLNAEIATRAADDVVLRQNLATEEKSRVAADADLLVKIGEIQAGGVAMLTEERELRVAADLELGAKIQVLEDADSASKGELVALLAAEEAARKAEDISIREDLEAHITEVDVEMKEVSEANKLALAAEIAERTAADGELKKAQADLDADFTAEKLARTAADVKLAGDMDKGFTLASKALEDEIATRKAKDVVLDTEIKKVDEKITDVKTSVADVKKALETESTIRSTADVAAANAMETEKTERVKADFAITSRIDVNQQAQKVYQEETGKTIDGKLDKSEDYKKRADGSFQINDFFYLGENWRVVTNKDPLNPKLVFEYFNGNDWKTGVPLVRGLSAPTPEPEPEV